MHGICDIRSSHLLFGETDDKDGALEDLPKGRGNSQQLHSATNNSPLHLEVNTLHSSILEYRQRDATLQDKVQREIICTQALVDNVTAWYSLQNALWTTT